MGKIKVSKGTARALENYKHFTFDDMMKLRLEYELTFNKSLLNKMRIQDLARALIDGYEVLEEPKEKWGRIASKCEEIYRDSRYLEETREVAKGKLDTIKEINKDFGLGIGL